MPSDENCSKRPGMPGVHIKRHGQGLPWPITRLSPSLPSWVIRIAVAALVFGQEAAQGKIVTEIQGVVGEESARAIQAMIEKARAPGAEFTAVYAHHHGSRAARESPIAASAGGE